MSQTPAVQVIHHLSEFQTLLQSHPNVVVNFGAAWCEPCKKLRPIYNTYPEKFPHIQFVKVDVDHDDGIGDQQGIEVLPTTVFFHKGQRVKQVKGADPHQIVAGCQTLVKSAGPDL